LIADLSFLNPTYRIFEKLDGDLAVLLLGKLAKIDNRLYVVAFTLRSSIIRLISARKADNKEVKRYETR
jgi:uncharacterized DUF497 family protein